MAGRMVKCWIRRSVRPAADYGHISRDSVSLWWFSPDTGTSDGECGEVALAGALSVGLVA